MAKLFNESQMSDPWAWCLGVIEKYNLTSKDVAEQLNAPRSTLRALLNGSNHSPRYDLLCKVVQLCIDYENRGVLPTEREPKSKLHPVVKKIEPADDAYDMI